MVDVAPHASRLSRKPVVVWKKMYKYGNHLTPGLTEVRSYAAFFAEGLRVRFRGSPALRTS